MLGKDRGEQYRLSAIVLSLSGRDRYVDVRSQKEKSKMNLSSDFKKNIIIDEKMADMSQGKKKR